MISLARAFPKRKLYPVELWSLSPLILLDLSSHLLLSLLFFHQFTSIFRANLGQSLFSPSGVGPNQQAQFINPKSKFQRDLYKSTTPHEGVPAAFQHVRGGV